MSMLSAFPTALILLAVVACAGAPPSEPSHDPRPAGELAAEAHLLAEHLRETPAAPLPDGAVRVRLAFGGDADLDLYATDPSFETVYFANSPTRAGGTLEADVRCDAPAPRIETVTFAAVRPGTYRVGVDFPESCEGGADEIGFAVRVDGAIAGERQGSIAKGHFLAVVLEVEAPDPP